MKSKFLSNQNLPLLAWFDSIKRGAEIVCVVHGCTVKAVLAFIRNSQLSISLSDKIRLVHKMCNITQHVEIARTEEENVAKKLDLSIRFKRCVHFIAARCATSVGASVATTLTLSPMPYLFHNASRSMCVIGCKYAMEPATHKMEGLHIQWVHQI